MVDSLFYMPSITTFLILSSTTICRIITATLFLLYFPGDRWQRRQMNGLINRQNNNATGEMAKELNPDRVKQPEQQLHTAWREAVVI